METDIVKITEVKKQDTVELAIADIHSVSQSTPPEIYTKSLHTMTHKNTKIIFVIGLSCIKRTHLCQNLAFIVLK